jgi:hypothetical protein
MIWKAEVTLTGVPLVEEATFERIHTYFKGVAHHEADAQELVLVWRYHANDINAALNVVATIRSFIARDLGGIPECTDVHVHTVSEE